MAAPPRPPDEPKRLAALHRARILDTKPERAFDDLVRLAAHLCRTPISLVSLVDADRQWFKARVGIDAEGTPRDVSFCTHAILGTEVFVVPDATRDNRFASNPLVTGEPRVRFYAGAPLFSVEGQPLGTLCVVDLQPRQITPEQKDALVTLARLARDQLEMRRNLAELKELVGQVKTLSGLVPICAWCRNVRRDDGFWSAVEDYVEQHSEAQFTHGICPTCADKAASKMRGGRRPAGEE